jgi:hypothetical protein
MSKRYEIILMHLDSSRAFEWYQEHDNECHGLEYLNMTNQTNNQSLIDRFVRF